MSSDVCDACEDKVVDHPDDCPNCGSDIEERCYGIRCTNYMCDWMRWWNDKRGMY